MAQSTSQAIWSGNNFLRNLKQIWMDTQIKEKHFYYFRSLRHWSVRAMLCTYFATLVLVGLLFSPEKQDSWAVVGSLSSLKSFQIEIPHARCPLAFISNLARVMLPTSTWWVMSASDFAYLCLCWRWLGWLSGLVSGFAAFVDSAQFRRYICRERFPTTYFHFECRMPEALLSPSLPWYYLDLNVTMAFIHTGCGELMQHNRQHMGNTGGPSWSGSKTLQDSLILFDSIW